MPIDILMPALSPTMTEGNLAKWVKKEGDAIKAGDVICEIETDKATMEVEAVEEGTLGKIIVAEGTQGVKVNEVIALLLEEGESADALGKSAAPKPAPAPENPKTEPAKAEAPKAEAAPAPKAASADHGERVFATPLARRMAEQAGIDLAGVTGSGPNGRIVKSDIEAAAGKPKQAAAPAAAAEAPKAAPAAVTAPAATALTKERVVALAGNIPYTEIPNTSMRKVIAKRLTEAKQTVPHFYLTVDCEIDQLLKIRAELNGKTEGLKISVNDFVIRASALALKKVPAANASWSDDVILQWSQADIAVAVAIEGGLITPIVKQAEGKGLATISAEMRDLGARAKAGKLKLEEFQGGTFSISNLGMFGIKEFSAVINPPHGAILAVGAGEQRPVVKNGALAVATVMSCTLSVDHRVVDGAVGAAFLKAFKGLIEDPLSMLL
ncbi:MAG TPA: pyruvate dehydrogenase complex dihydrolipoamide acetyltransferase [Aliidongia sp.]|uniref:pyruvate dehydrogenase complex dihydrolipoamide acetyltransferase n=1 Tax=Aliidongia sp. TaxID=1914230 RepID=UPI002DDCC202|nr:pyruvate dehydrogenase complex dihydrolipoamide acetyltransferase [Aliidongia sp.]HEV2678531.1 pyruvate dehydrogenase complex dihydrolipoamide acetyltransferase [Aliidongia sp.]